MCVIYAYNLLFDPKPNLGSLKPPFFPFALGAGVVASTSTSGEDCSNSPDGRFTSAALSSGRSKSSSAEASAVGALISAPAFISDSISPDGPETSVSTSILGNLT